MSEFAHCAAFRFESACAERARSAGNPGACARNYPPWLAVAPTLISWRRSRTRRGHCRARRSLRPWPSVSLPRSFTHRQTARISGSLAYVMGQGRDGGRQADWTGTRRKEPNRDSGGIECIDGDDAAFQRQHLQQLGHRRNPVWIWPRWPSRSAPADAAPTWRSPYRRRGATPCRRSRSRPGTSR